MSLVAEHRGEHAAALKAGHSRSRRVHFASEELLARGYIRRAVEIHTQIPYLYQGADAHEQHQRHHGAKSDQQFLGQIHGFSWLQLEADAQRRKRLTRLDAIGKWSELPMLYGF